VSLRSSGFEQKAGANLKMETIFSIDLIDLESIIVIVK
jgi:hypothetical protein